MKTGEQSKIYVVNIELLYFPTLIPSISTWFTQGCPTGFSLSCREMKK